MSNQAPFRYDVVGSFLRPEYLKDARAKFAEGKITEEQLKETEDKAIKELVEKEKEVIEDKQIKQEQATGTAVKSPIVGVFYSASSPESDPYVTVGKTVKKGDIVCIIEAMKVMNEIKAPCDGTVTSILVENEALVEYDQALMVIEENV